MVRSNRPRRIAAILLLDDLLDAADRMARHSRPESERALPKGDPVVRASARDRIVTQGLDSVYGNAGVGSSLDVVIREMQAASIPTDDDVMARREGGWAHV